MRVARTIGIGLGGLIALALLVAGIMYAVGGSRLARTYDVELANLTVPSDSAAVAHGAHVMRTNGCNDCHGESLEGKVIIDAPPFRVVASNLTRGRGGVGGSYSDSDWDRSIRHGVKPDGRPVVIMPSAAFHELSDDDAAALIAYVKSVPPADNELPKTEIRTIGRLMSAVADPSFEVRTTRPPRASAPARAATEEYGTYLTSGTCAYCHGATLRGAKPPNPESPPAPDLANAGAWTREQFIDFARSGMRPDGSAVDQNFMPISLTAQMPDDDLAAIHLRLSKLR
jgi:mono/diheme cytochrome c family protein